MGWLKRLIGRAVPETRAGESVLAPTNPLGRRSGDTTTEQAVTIPAVYRALDILATAGAQLPIVAEKAGEKLADTPPIVRRPSLRMTRSDWTVGIVLDMATHGDAPLIVRRDANRTAVALDPVPSARVLVDTDKKGTTWGHYDGDRYRISGPDPDMMLITKMRLPGRTRGLGPIQAAMSTIAGALDVRDYAAHWFQGAGQPSGILSTDQVLTNDNAREYVRMWNTLKADGTLDLDRIRENPAGVKVLGKGLTYQPLLLNPTDAKWLEAQQWTALDISRLFGVPTSLMLTSPAGGTNTYQNVAQDWLAFARFTLAGYLRPIEEALSAVLVRGQTARYNLDALLRSDQKTRYEGHEIAIRAGFLTVDEVRSIEGYEPMNGVTA